MKRQTLEQKILTQLITKYTIEKQPNKRWWIFLPIVVFWVSAGAYIPYFDRDDKTSNERRTD